MQDTIDFFWLYNRFLNLFKERQRTVNCVCRTNDVDMNSFTTGWVGLAIWAKSSEAGSGINTPLLAAEQELRLRQIRALQQVGSWREQRFKRYSLKDPGRLIPRPAPFPAHLLGSFHPRHVRLHSRFQTALVAAPAHRLRFQPASERRNSSGRWQYRSPTCQRPASDQHQWRRRLSQYAVPTRELSPRTRSAMNEVSGRSALDSTNGRGSARPIWRYAVSCRHLWSGGRSVQYAASACP